MHICVPLILSSVLVLFATGSWAFDVPERYRDGVTVVHSNNMPPMSFGGLNGEPKGFLIDFWRKWSTETGVPVSFRLTTWKDGLELVRTGECDIHGGLFSTEDRRKYFDYSDKIFPVKTALFIRTDSGIKGMTDIGDKWVGVLEKGSAEEYLRKHYPKLKLKSYLSIDEAMVAFASGGVSVIVTDYPTLMYLSAKHAILNDVHAVKILFEDSMRAAVAKGNSDLLDLVARGIEQIDPEEREYILHRWYVSEPDDLNTLKIVVALAVIGLLGALVFLVFGGRARRSR